MVRTQLLCKACLTLRLAVLGARLNLNRSNNEKGLSALHICRGSAIFWSCCRNAREMSWQRSDESKIWQLAPISFRGSQECTGRAPRLEHGQKLTERSGPKKNPADVAES